jgi:uncharacterized protein (DUF3084 family)
MMKYLTSTIWLLGTLAVSGQDQDPTVLREEIQGYKARITQLQAQEKQDEANDRDYDLAWAQLGEEKAAGIKKIKAQIEQYYTDINSDLLNIKILEDDLARYKANTPVGKIPSQNVIKQFATEIKEFQDDIKARQNEIRKDEAQLKKIDVQSANLRSEFDERQDKLKQSIAKSKGLIESIQADIKKDENLLYSIVPQDRPFTPPEIVVPQ